jgi:hypothetical protein
MRLNEVITEYPHLVGCELLEGRRIVKANDNKMHCMCFTCIDNMMTESVGVLLSTGKKENNVPPSTNLSNNPIEKCPWDDAIVATTLTNKVSWAKKGEPLKSSNSTLLQGFHVNGVILSTDKLSRIICSNGQSDKRRVAQGKCQSSHSVRQSCSGKGSMTVLLPTKLPSYSIHWQICVFVSM